MQQRPLNHSAADGVYGAFGMFLRSAFFVTLALLAGCSSDTTPSSVPTTAESECLRVSQVFATNMQMEVPSALAATRGQRVWYVASADGAVWSSTADPTLGIVQQGFMAPLNQAAFQVSAIGRNNGIGGEHAQGATAEDAGAAEALRCARAAES